MLPIMLSIWLHPLLYGTVWRAGWSGRLVRPCALRTVPALLALLLAVIMRQCDHCTVQHTAVDFVVTVHTCTPLSSVVAVVVIMLSFLDFVFGSFLFFYVHLIANQGIIPCTPFVTMIGAD